MTWRRGKVDFDDEELSWAERGIDGEEVAVEPSVPTAKIDLQDEARAKKAWNFVNKDSWSEERQKSSSSARRQLECIG